MTDKIHFVHDRFMKSMLGDINVARLYFDVFLPDSMKKIIDLSELEHITKSFVSDSLQETFADIIFKCPLKEPHHQEILYLSLLFEHRSTEYKFVSIQLGGYLFDAYREQLKNKADPLFPVIPFLYYHGNTKWNPISLDQLFEKYPTDIKDFLPGFRFLYENIQNYSDEQIRQLSEGLLSSSLLMQKYAYSPKKLINRFNDIFLILNSWDQGNLFKAIVVYFFQIVEIEEDELNDLITQIPQVMKTEFISLADKLTQKGHQEGRQEGRQEGQLEERNRKNRIATENMLRKGFEVAIICDVLEVTPEYVESVRIRMSDQNDDE